LACSTRTTSYAGQTVTSVSAVNGVVYGGSVATTGVNMYALDAATGKILWSHGDHRNPVMTVHLPASEPMGALQDAALSPDESLRLVRSVRLIGETPTQGRRCGVCDAG
jgi:PQQ enzyme repeat